MGLSSILITIGLNSKAVKTGLASLRSEFTAFRGSIAGISTGILGAFSFQKAIDKALDIAPVARKFGITAEEAQKLGAAVKRAGGDMETASKGGWKAFAAAQKALSEGGGAERKKFEALKISPEQLANVGSAYDMILLLADAVHGASNQHVALAAASDLLGERQASLIQLLKMGKEEILKIGNSTSVMSNATVIGIEKASKSLTKFGTYMTSFAGMIIGLGNKVFEGLGNMWGSVTVPTGSTRDLDEYAQAMDHLNGLLDRQRRLHHANRDDLAKSLDPKIEAARNRVIRAQYPELDDRKKLEEDINALISKRKQLSPSTANNEEVKRMDEQVARLQKRLAEIKNGNLAGGTDAIDAEAQQKAADDLESAKDALAKREVENARALMELEQKRNALIEDRKNLIIEAEKAGLETVEGYKKRTEAAGITGQIQGVDKEIASKKEQADQKAESREERIASLRAANAKIVRDAQYEALRTDKDRIAFLEKEKSALEIKQGGTGNIEDYLKVEGEKLEKQRAIDGLKLKGGGEDKIAADSMRRIGLGGRAVVLKDHSDPMEKAAKTLDDIKRQGQGQQRTLEKIETKLKPTWQP